MNNYLNIYTVSLFGHRYIDNVSVIEDKLEPIIENIIRNRVRKRLEYEDCSLILILPYVTAEYEKNEDYFYQYYDDVEICYEASYSHYKTAITIRNKYMVDRLNFIICYTAKQNGGAYTALKYAEKKDKNILNIAESV